MDGAHGAAGRQAAAVSGCTDADVFATHELQIFASGTIRTSGARLHSAHSAALQRCSAEVATELSTTATASPTLIPIETRPYDPLCSLRPPHRRTLVQLPYAPGPMARYSVTSQWPAARHHTDRYESAGRLPSVRARCMLAWSCRSVGGRRRGTGARACKRRRALRSYFTSLSTGHYSYSITATLTAELQNCSSCRLSM